MVAMTTNATRELELERWKGTICISFFISRLTFVLTVNNSVSLYQSPAESFRINDREKKKTKEANVVVFHSRSYDLLERSCHRAMLIAMLKSSKIDSKTSGSYYIQGSAIEPLDHVHDRI